MHRPFTSQATILRLAGTAALAVLLALPAVGLTCPPEMQDVCPLQVAEKCSMNAEPTGPVGEGDNGRHAATGLERAPMSCCVGADAPIQGSTAVVPPAPDAPAAPFVAAQVAAPVPAPAPPTPAPALEDRPPSTPLYTLHSSLLS